MNRYLKQTVLTLLFAFVICLFGCSTELTYTVTFVDEFNGNNVQTIVENNLVNKPADPTHEGYNFIGWYTNINSESGESEEVLFDFDTQITKDYTLNAKYEKQEIFYNVTIKVQNTGNNYDNVKEYQLKVKENSKIDAEELNKIDTLKPGFKFLGYYLETSNTEFDLETQITSDITLVAKYEEIFYTVIIKVQNTGNDYNNVKEYQLKVKENSKIDVEELNKIDTLKPGFKFLGYYLESSNTEFDLETQITSDITLIAKYEEIFYTVTIKVQNTEDDLDELKEYQLKIKENGKIDVEELNKIDTLKPGFDFLGYYLESSNTIFDLETQITSDIVLMTKYEKIREIFIVTFYDRLGKEIAKVNVKDGDPAIAPELPVDNGYEFIEWDTDISVITENIDVYGIYDIVNYTITYDGDDDGDNPKEYDTETKDIKLNDIELEGYRFKGWYLEKTYENKVEVIKKGSYGDLVLYPYFEKIKYVTVDFDVNGGKLLGYTDRQEVNNYTITKYNGDYFKDYLANVFIYDFEKDPQARYSLRIALKEEVHNNEKKYIVSDYIESGEYSSNHPFSDCKYVIVVAEQGKYYNAVLSNLEIGLEVKLPGLENSDTEDVTISATYIKGGEGKHVFEDGDFLPIPMYKGYIFEGWFDENDVKHEQITLETNENINLTAKWIVDVNAPAVEVERILSDISEMLSGYISKDLNLFTVDEESGATLEWFSNDEELISKEGKVNCVIGQYKTTALTVKINYLGKETTHSFGVNLARGYKDIYNGGVIAGYNYFSTVPDDTTLKEVDILYCPFATAGTNGHVTNMVSFGNYVKKYVDKAHSYGDYVIICVSTSELATVAASDNLIDIFVEDIITCINDYDIDGVDIDWETPTVATKTNFTKLMKKLYTRVKENNNSHIVTAATAGGPWQYPRFDLENSIKYIDFINLMTYDLQTNSNSTHHNGLYRSSKGYTLTQCTIDQSIPLYNAVNVPNSKILVGIPFYGRKFINTEGIGKASAAGGSINQENIYNQYLKNTPAGVTLGFDDECKVPYIYDSNNKLFISYDDERSIAYKADYIKEKGLAGMMYWQNAQDYQHKLLNAMYKAKDVMKWS